MDQKDDLLAKIDEAIAASQSLDHPALEEARSRRPARFIAPEKEDSLSLNDLEPTLEAIKDLQAKLELSFNMQDAIQLDFNKARLDLKTALEKNKEMETELAGLKVAHQEKVRYLDQLRDELSFLEEEKLIGDEKIRDLQDQLKKNEQMTADFGEELKLMEQDKKNHVQENDNLKRQLASSESHIAELDKEISKIQDSREKYQSRTQELEREVSSLRATKEALLEIRKALADTNAKVRERFYKNRENR